MGIPLSQVVRIGGYVAKQHLTRRKRYPLVLMLEPLFRCNLACAGCGKIDYPDEILDQRLRRRLSDQAKDRDEREYGRGDRLDSVVGQRGGAVGQVICTEAARRTFQYTHP